MGRFSHKRVVVGIIYDPERGFLLPYNDRWHHFAFVMKQVGDDQAVAQVAIDALKEDIRLRFPDAKATAVDRVGAYGISDRTGEENYYDYTVYLYDLGPTQGGTASSKDARFFAYEELLDDDDVSWNTKEIVQALVERREVVVAVISRQGATGTECLLVNSRPTRYFPPSTRRKTDIPPEAVAAAAIQQDTGYDGPVEATWVGEQEIIQTSRRFGKHETQFRFHVCRVDLPDGNLQDASGPFGMALHQREQQLREAGAEILPEGYFRWYPLDQLRTAQDVSPTLPQIMMLVVQAAESRSGGA